MPDLFRDPVVGMDSGLRRNDGGRGTVMPDLFRIQVLVRHGFRPVPE